LVREKRHARFRSVFLRIKSWFIPFANSVSDVVSAKKRFAFKLKLKFEGSGVNKICYTLGNPG